MAIHKMVEKILFTLAIQQGHNPNWIVAKKTDGNGKRKLSFVLDFPAGNEKTVHDQYPIPVIIYLVNETLPILYHFEFDKWVSPNENDTRGHPKNYI